jgi:Ca-activated chloride channel family protein
VARLFKYLFYPVEVIFRGQFASPHLLYLLIFIPILILFYVFAFHRKRRSLSRFGNLALVEKLSSSVSRKAQIWKALLLVVAFLILIISMARPKMGEKNKPGKRKGQDIMIALDVSLSMMAEDIKPNRLEKAKHEIREFIDNLKGDRVGLLVFAGKPFVWCPLTIDYSAARMFLDSIGPDLIPEPGTGIGNAIQKAMLSFVKEEKKHKVLVLITDGEDHQGKPVEMAEAAAKEGIVIYTVGIGSSAGGPIPVKDGMGNRTGYKKDRNGGVVMTRIDELTLKSIAWKTGGEFYRVTGSEAVMDSVYKHIDEMEKKSLGSVQYTHMEDRFQPFVGMVILILIIEMFIPERRRVRKEWKGRFE